MIVVGNYPAMACIHRCRNTSYVPVATVVTMIGINVGNIRTRYIGIGMNTGVFIMRMSGFAHIGRALDAHEKQRDQHQIAKERVHIRAS